MPAERLDARDAGEFGHVQRADAHGDELRGEVVAPVRADAPAGAGRVPFEALDLGVEEGVVVQAEVFADAAAVFEDLGRVRVLLRRHVPGLLEQRHVHVRGRVALRARVAVPVPRAAEVAALLDDAHVLDAGLLQPRAGDEPGEAAADDGDRHVAGLRRAPGDRGVGVVEVVGEAAGEAEVLVVAVRTQPLVTLFPIFQAKRLFVDDRVIGHASSAATGWPRRWGANSKMAFGNSPGKDGRPLAPGSP
jgi:hypothetical protein